MTTSLIRPRSARVAARTARAPSPARRPGSASATTSLKPAWSSRSTIGRPMFAEADEADPGVDDHRRRPAISSCRDRRTLPWRCGRPRPPRDAGIDADLQQHLGDLVPRHAVGERAADMQLELMHAAERREHGEVQHAARLALEPGARPHPAPAILGDEILKRPGERIGVGERTVDVVRAEHRAPHRQPVIIEFLVHPILPLGIRRRRHAGSTSASQSSRIFSAAPAIAAARSGPIGSRQNSRIKRIPPENTGNQ